MLLCYVCYVHFWHLQSNVLCFLLFLLLSLTSSTYIAYIALQPFFKCIWSIFNMLYYTQYLMIWLKSSKCQLLKTFCRLKIGWILGKLWAKMCVCSLPIFDVFDIHSITALRCIWSIFDIFDIDSITFKENENDISDIFDMSHTLYSVQITM